MSGRSKPATTAAAIGVVGTTAVILPAFLTGAVAVQIRDDLAVSESAIGLAIGAFFAGSALGSTWLGRLAERLGPVIALRIGLIVTMAADLTVAGLVQGTASLAAVLVIAGLGNALVQPAINLLVVRSVGQRRLGLVMALKQSGMPAAALLGGLAVPIIALTIGWRAAYLGGACLAVISMVLVGSFDRADPGQRRSERPATTPSGSIAPSRRASRLQRPRPDQGRAVLAVMAGVGVLGGGAANIVVGYLVSGAVAAGISPGPAGLVLTAGSALGIASRLSNGWLVDRGGFDPLVRVVALLGIGLIGAMILAVHRPLAYLVATPLVFAGGWAWPGLFNLVVVQANRSAPAAATGITQTGVYLGSVIGPVLAGALIESSGYRAAWLVTAVSLGAAALATLIVRSQMIEVERPPVGG